MTSILPPVAPSSSSGNYLSLSSTMSTAIPIVFLFSNIFLGASVRVWDILQTRKEAAMSFFSLMVWGASMTLFGWSNPKFIEVVLLLCLGGGFGLFLGGLIVRPISKDADSDDDDDDEEEKEQEQEKPQVAEAEGKYDSKMNFLEASKDLLKAQTTQLKLEKAIQESQATLEASKNEIVTKTFLVSRLKQEKRNEWNTKCMLAPVGAQFLAPVKESDHCVVYALVNLQRIGEPGPISSATFTPHWVLYDPARQKTYQDYSPDLLGGRSQFPIVPVDRGTLLTSAEELKSYMAEFIEMENGTVIYDFDVPVPPNCPLPPPPPPVIVQSLPPIVVSAAVSAVPPPPVVVPPIVVPVSTPGGGKVPNILPVVAPLPVPLTSSCVGHHQQQQQQDPFEGIIYVAHFASSSSSSPSPSFVSVLPETAKTLNQEKKPGAKDFDHGKAALELVAAVAPKKEDASLNTDESKRNN